MQLDSTDIMANMQDGEELPQELQDLIEEMRIAKAAKIEQIGKYVAKLRDEAVTGRKQSGIEDIWEADEEYYQGIDDANRDSHPWLKSASTTGGISRTPVKSETRCTAFFNITRQFVDSAAARMGDILLPAGDWNFSIKPTPVQDKAETAEFTEGQSMQAPAIAPPAPNMEPGFQQETQNIPGGASEPPLGVPPSGLAVDANVQPGSDPQKAAVAKAEKAELKIRDWLVECSYPAEFRKVIEDAARLGTGVLKGPYPDKFSSIKTNETEAGFALEIVQKTGPRSSHVDVWDFFPDPACGESIHNGSYCFERDRLTAKQLKNLKSVPGYLPDQIDKVLEEGPGKKFADMAVRQKDDATKDCDKFEIWYFYGLVDVGGLSAMSVKLTGDDAAKDKLPAIVTLVNDTPIKAFINPLDTGEFPYDLMPWQRQPGMPWGIGVSRQGRTAQDMLNASARRLMDNAGLAAAPQLIFRQNAVRPADGQWNIYGGKIWIATEQADIRSVQDAILAINIPMMQAELTAMVQMARQMMEENTGMFFIMQGQQGSAPDTVGGMELLHRNASAVLRRLARVADEALTEPHIRRYYAWLMQHGPEDCKGDMQIQAVGSTALVEREIQAMEAMAFLQMAANPIFGLDPEKAALEVLRAKRMNPDKWVLDDEKKAKLSQQQPTIPAIEVAKIRAATDEKRMQLQAQTAQQNQQTQLQKMQVDTDRDSIYVQSQANRDNQAHMARIEELRIKRELAILEYSNKRNIEIDKIKADLAQTSMKLRVQKELAAVANKMTPEVVHPPTEPPQLAKPGHAFEQ